MNEVTQLGFEYIVEVVDKDGVVTDREVVHNIMPVQGMDHLLSVLLKGGAQTPNWYIGLFNTPYTPLAGDTAATFPGAAGEMSDYASATRPLFEGGTPSFGTIDNSAAVTEFEFTTEDTIHGGFIASASAKGSTSGILLSAVRFGTPKNVEPTSALRVTAGFSLVSL